MCVSSAKRAFYGVDDGVLICCILVFVCVLCLCLSLVCPLFKRLLQVSAKQTKCELCCVLQCFRGSLLVTQKTQQLYKTLSNYGFIWFSLLRYHVLIILTCTGPVARTAEGPLHVRLAIVQGFETNSLKICKYDPSLFKESASQKSSQTQEPIY